MSSRPMRNILLAGAAAVGGVSAVLQLVSTSLTFSDFLSFPRFFTELEVAAGLDALALAFALAAFGTALAAFLLTSRRTRRTVLAVAGFLFVGDGLAEFGGDLIRVIFGASHSEPWKFLASQGAAAAGGASLAVAALLVALGVRAARPDRRLGWGSIGLAGAFALLCVAYSFELAAVLQLSLNPPGKFIGGLETIVGGHFVTAAAAVVAGVAFFTSNGRRQRGEDWQVERERSLGIAASVFAVGFLATSIGLMLLAASEGGGGRNMAERWLLAVGQLMLALAAVCGAVGFFLSRRDAERRASASPAPAPAA